MALTETGIKILKYLAGRESKRQIFLNHPPEFGRNQTMKGEKIN
jgi:hypothetical protein